MPVNFFDKTQKTSSSNSQFGLCNDQPPAENPAYIDEQNRSSWIGIVDNPVNKQVDFYPIDHCVPLFRPKIAKEKNQILRKIHTVIIQCFNIKELESRCDGVLRFSNSLFFVELKTRTSHKWLATGKTVGSIERLDQSIETSFSQRRNCPFRRFRYVPSRH